MCVSWFKKRIMLKMFYDEKQGIKIQTSLVP